MKVPQLRRGPLAVAVATLVALTLPALSLPGSWDVYTGGVMLGAIMLVLALAKPPSSAAASLSGPRRWWALGFLGSTGLLVGLDAATVTVALPTMARTFPDATFGGLASIVVAYLVGIASMVPYTAGLTDRFGPKRVLACGLSLFGVALLAGGYLSEVWPLMVARVVQGVGVGLMGPTAIGTIRRMLGEDGRLAGRICPGMGALGLVLGGVLGAVLVERSDLQTTTYVVATLVVVALAGTHWLVPETRPHASESDPIGVALSAQAIGILAFVIAAVSAAGWASPTVIVWGAVALALLGALAVRRAWRQRREVRSVRIATIARGILLFLVFGVVFAVTFYFQELQRYSPLETGLALLPLVVGIAGGGFASDRFVRSLGAPVTTTFGLLVGAVAVMGLGMAALSTGSWVLMGVALAGMGLATGLVLATTRRSIATTHPAPYAKAGAPFAVGALGVAVIGTVIGTSYSDQVVVRAGKLGFPPSVAESAAEDVTRGVEVATAQPGIVGRVLGYVVEIAYGDAFTATLFISGALGFVAGGVVAMFSFKQD